MKDSSQTLVFLGAAIVAVFFAMYSQPSDATYQADEQIGRPLFSAESNKATAMRIVRFDEASATLREFEVAEKDGLWSLPSKGGYPADAAEQMAAATAGVAELEILNIASLSAGDHAEYGVVEPSSDLDPGQTGVGKRVVLESADGETLVDIVIGAEVRGEDDQRYVRRTSQDPVYVVRINPEDFSTSFEDWIQQDLLNLQAWDIKRVKIKDYSSQLETRLTQRGLAQVLAIDPRAQLTLAYDESDSEWRPVELLKYNRQSESYEPFELGEDQQLDADALDEMKTAVGDLEIVDVERKPSGLSADLKGGESLFTDEASYRSLVSRGFAPAGDGDEIFSTEGEVAIGMKDGVEYLLRFGNLQLESDEEEKTPAAEGDDPAKPDASDGVNRYLFVVARVNADLLEKPELEEVPSAEEKAGDESDESEDDASDEADETDETTDDQADASESAEEIEQRNQRKQDEYDDKLAKAKERVAELNGRFGDWYYVISDEVYKKIALGRDELIVAKEASDEEEGPSEPEGPRGPLGGAANAVPGLPTVPGVDFNPAAEAAEEGAESEPASEETPAAESPEEEE